MDKYINKIIRGDAVLTMHDMPDQCVDLVIHHRHVISKTHQVMVKWPSKWFKVALLNGYEHHHGCMPHDVR